MLLNRPGSSTIPSGRTSCLEKNTLRRSRELYSCIHKFCIKMTLAFLLKLNKFFARLSPGTTQFWKPAVYFPILLSCHMAIWLRYLHYNAQNIISDLDKHNHSTRSFKSHSYVTLEHKISLTVSSTGIFVAITKQYIVWVKITDFSFMP